MIHIYKASAGSGKTFTLAKQYITLLLQADNNEAYRNILAVTFTNKATDEMKSRILLELYVLSKDPKKSAYFNSLVPMPCKDEASLKSKASTILINLLHDYSMFSVSTIDRFFQQTLKAFTREIGQFASYQIELDRDILVDEAVDRVLDALTDSKQDAPKLNWLTNSTLSELEAGRRFRLDAPIKDVAKRLLSEEHRVLLEKYDLKAEDIYNPKALDELAKGCNQYIKKYKQELTRAKEDLVRALFDVGIDPIDTKTSFLHKALVKYDNLDADIPNLTNSVRTKLSSSDYEDWFKKDDVYKAKLIGVDQQNAINSFLSMFDKPLKIYNTAVLLESKIYGLGLANDLYQEFRTMLKEKNVLSLDDSNTILKNIIDGTDAPFIYEKTGIKYKHFLLDEFQDTSRVQWDNFIPLLKNSEAEGNYNLIVGDVKQSIYRWRNSDWNLLRNEVKNNFNNVKEETLEYNWRSMENIIRFNNDFFKRAAKFLDDEYEANCNEIQDIYSDVEQKVGKKTDDNGQVICTFCDKEDELQVVYKAVSDANTRNYSSGDIAILVRGLKEGEAIANYLMSKDIKVVTDGSLLLSSSLTVTRLVSLLSVIDNPDDKISQYLADKLSLEIPKHYHSLIDLCEELLRGLQVNSKDVFESEFLYIQFFMDKVRNYINSYGNDLHGFLKYWETNKNKDKIVSPAYEDAVTIMTIHKSKGLDFPYVIVPFFETIKFYKDQYKWSKPNVQGTHLETYAKGIYDVNLSNKSMDNLFADNFREELLMQYVDNINIAYVASTRAQEVVHIIAELPQKTINKHSNFAQFLYNYVNNPTPTDSNETYPVFQKTSKHQVQNPNIHDSNTEEEESIYEEYIFGSSFIHKAKTLNAKLELSKAFPAEFCSWKLDNRLKNHPEAIDFFIRPEDDTIIEKDSSSILKGNILHEILSKINSKEDLDYAIETAIFSGVLEKIEVDKIKQTILNLINDKPEWFGDNVKQSYNEVEIVGLDGFISRPDRVVILEDEVIIIDYKTGAHFPRYERQLNRYGKLYREMGYKNVRKFLWYIHTGILREVF